MAKATAAAWSAITDGTAVGDPRTIAAGEGQSIVVTPLWSDDEGIVVDVQVPDRPLPIQAAEGLIAALRSVSDLAPPR